MNTGGNKMGFSLEVPFLVGSSVRYTEHYILFNIVTILCLILLEHCSCMRPSSGFSHYVQLVVLNAALHQCVLLVLIIISSVPTSIILFYSIYISIFDIV